MNCSEVRRFFGAYWDDDTTQAEREWLEAHLSTCASCRREYDELSRVLEWTASLPRAEVSPDLVERTLVRARRAVTAADRIPTVSVPWVPATAAAALLLITGILISPWIRFGSERQTATRVTDQPAVQQPVLVAPDPTLSGRAPESAKDRVASIPDSLFDPSEDVEFILDPVTLRRGRATMTSVPAPQGEQAIITF